MPDTRTFDADDVERSVFAYVRIGRETDPMVVVAMNITPVAQTAYRLGLPDPGGWRGVLNSDATDDGGGGRGNMGGVKAEPMDWTGQGLSAEVTIPPLSPVVFISNS